MSKTLVIIPARYGSTRFPGKVLADILGKSMIERVYNQISLAISIDKIVIATDHPGVFQHAETFCKDVIMTSGEHNSGTDRCAEVANLMAEFDIVVNVQGDNPLISPKSIDNLVAFHRQNMQREITTLVNRKHRSKALKNPHVVKVVLNKNKEALYFSRASIPYNQNNFPTDYYTHVGIYCFRRDVLLDISELPHSMLETAESLEQLRWMEEGYRIFCLETDEQIISVDIPKDLTKVKDLLTR